ncbi:FAD-binding oxidoreductase [Candidatus Woesearchaeota archaeon]|nr:FAD-binding oxidoreductase [Candidatus Woesearchaeota archaeon]
MIFIIGLGMKLQDIFTKAYSEISVDKIVYGRDASELEGSCQAVVWPTHKEQVQHMLKFASKDMHFTIRGAGSNTLGAAVPSQSIVVDMSRMNKILEWGSDFVVVESGLVLGELLTSLEKKRLVFPIKPLELPLCTIGGMIAMNTYGLDTYYGRMENWVEELEVIDGEGNRVKVSGAQLKDFLGAEGITGIILSAKLKLLTEPRQKTVSIFKFNTITSLMDKAIILDKSPNVLAIEYLDDFCSHYLSLGQSLHLLVEYGNDAGVIKDPEEIAKIDELKEKLQHVLINKKYTQKEDPKISIQQHAKFLHWCQKNGVPCFGHMKLGIFHPNFREGSPLQREMHMLVMGLQGEIAGQYGIGRKRKRSVSLDRKVRLQTLKTKYDPKKILNRGILID